MSLTDAHILMEFRSQIIGLATLPLDDALAPQLRQAAAPFVAKLKAMGHDAGTAAELLRDVFTDERNSRKRFIPAQSINDDDWYVYEPRSKQVIYSIGGRVQPPIKDGQAVVRGLSAKGLGLWRFS
jgi:hypothetical protein